MNRLVIVLLDGLSADAASRHMSFMRALVENDTARHTVLEAGLPPLSRPVYATLLTGLTPAQCGILRNEDARVCPKPTLFSRARDAGLITAAAAYCWISELCNRAPFEPGRDRLCDDPALAIRHGLFYSQDAYPDDELFRDAEALRLRHAPHLLLAHGMGVDFAGHQAGADSRQYREAARTADGLLARYLPLWLDAGHMVLVTADHGMDADGSHWDVTDAARRVPFWLAGAPAAVPLPRRQTDIADLAARLLGLQ